MRNSKTIESIKELTNIFHSSQDDMICGIKQCIESEGINPKELIVAELFPDDTCFELGIVITKSGKVFQFGYNYFENQENKGSFTEWHDLTNQWQGTPHSQRIEAALKYHAENT